jgi:hypothetical protein
MYGVTTPGPEMALNKNHSLAHMKTIAEANKIIQNS